MTEPPDRGSSDRKPGPEPAPAAIPARPGTRIFTIEGRAAPGLFVVGWIASILGGALLLGGTVGRSPLIVLLGLILTSLGLIAAAGSQAIERQARHEAYAGPSPFLVFAAAIPITFLLGTVVGAMLDSSGVVLARPIASFIVVVLQVAVYLGLVQVLVVGTGALSWRQMGFVGNIREAGSDIGWGLVFAGPIIAATTLVALVLVEIIGRVPESPLPPTGEASGLLLNLVTGALLAPVGEEILFRGFATTAWARAMPAWPAILRGAVAFAVAHVIAVQGATLDEALGVAIVGFGTRLPIAIVLGYLLLRRGTIWAPIGLHAAFNGAILVIAELAPRAA